MRTRVAIAGAFLSLAFVGVSWNAVATAAAPADAPTPLPSGSSQIGFTVVGTSTPTPPPSGGGGTGGTGQGGSGGNSGGGAVVPPACVPSTKTPALAIRGATKATALSVAPDRIARGDSVLVKGSGFQPGEKVVIGLYSTPVNLGTFTVRTNGQVYEVVTIPIRTQLGSHALRAIGYEDCHVAAGSINVVSPRGLGFSVFPWVVWIIAGSAVGVAGVGILLAFVLGWLPIGVAGGIATKVTP